MLDDGSKIQNCLSRLKWWTHTTDCTEGFKDIHSCRKREMWLSNSLEIDFCKSHEPVDCLLIWLMDALVFYFTSIVFLNAWILMSLDKAFIFRFPTALLAPCYLTCNQIHTFMLTAWSLQAFEIVILNHRIFVYFLICFALTKILSGSQEVIGFLKK